MPIYYLVLPLPHPGVSRVKRRGLGPTVARPPTDKFHVCLQTTCYISDFGGYVFVVSNGSAPLNVHAAMQSSAFIADKIIIKKTPLQREHFSTSKQHASQLTDSVQRSDAQNTLAIR